MQGRPGVRQGLARAVAAEDGRAGMLDEASVDTSARRNIDGRPLLNRTRSPSSARSWQPRSTTAEECARRIYALRIPKSAQMNSSAGRLRGGFAN